MQFYFAILALMAMTANSQSISPDIYRQVVQNYLHNGINPAQISSANRQTPNNIVTENRLAGFQSPLNSNQNLKSLTSDVSSLQNPQKLQNGKTLPQQPQQRIHGDISTITQQRTFSSGGVVPTSKTAQDQGEPLKGTAPSAAWLQRIQNSRFNTAGVVPPSSQLYYRPIV